MQAHLVKLTTVSTNPVLNGTWHPDIHDQVAPFIATGARWAYHAVHNDPSAIIASKSHHALCLIDVPPQANITGTIDLGITGNDIPGAIAKIKQRSVNLPDVAVQRIIDAGYPLLNGNLFDTLADIL